MRTVAYGYAKVAGKREFRQVDEKRTTKTMQSPDFYTTPKTPENRPFFIFSEYGDYIYGKLLAKQNNHNINRTCSYKIAVIEVRQGGKDVKVKTNSVEEFFANRQVQRMIDKNELIGSRIRIEFIGRLKSQWSGGHAAKIYRIDKNCGAITSDFRRQEECPVKRKKKA